MSECTKVIKKLEEKIADYEEFIDSLSVKARSIGIVRSEPHTTNNITSFRVDVDGHDKVLSSRLPKIPIGRKVLILGDMIEKIMPEEFEQKVEEHRITLATWNDVGGLRSQVQQIREAVELPLKNAKLFKEFGMTPVAGILLYGEPGCGKTLIAKAIASSILSNNAHEGAFTHIKGSDIFDKFVGESEKIITSLFDAKRRHMIKYGERGVIFIDEAEHALGRRNGHSFNLVTSFLAEMDGMYVDKPLVILATNLPNDIDPAITREGRIDIKLHIGRPDENDFKEIVGIHLNHKLLHHDSSFLAETATELVFEADKHKASGALAASLVNMAAKEAIVRFIKTKNKKGITDADLVTAFLNIRGENATH